MKSFQKTAVSFRGKTDSKWYFLVLNYLLLFAIVQKIELLYIWIVYDVLENVYASCKVLNYSLLFQKLNCFASGKLRTYFKMFDMKVLKNVTIFQNVSTDNFEKKASQKWNVKSNITFVLFCFFGSKLF
jgi:hypothetical protein